MRTLTTVKGYPLPSGYWNPALPSSFKTLPLGQLDQALISAALDRINVIVTPLADVVFAVCDLVYLADPRIAELRN